MKYPFLLLLIILTTLFFWFTPSEVSACGACQTQTGTFSVRNCALVSVPDYGCSGWSTVCYDYSCWQGGGRYCDTGCRRDGGSEAECCWTEDRYMCDQCCTSCSDECRGGWVIIGYHKELSCWNEVVENCRDDCNGNQTCDNGACRDNTPPSPCGGPCTLPEVCNIDLKKCVNPNAGTQSCGQQTCGNGQVLRCSPDCNSASPQCYCEGAASQECSGGNTSSCGVNPTCPINQGPGYWVCNGGRCETVCRASSPGNESCVPRAASCTYCWSGSQQCDNGCNTWTQDCATGCTASKPQKPIAISPSGETTAKNVAFKYKSFSNLAEWGSFCPINTNSYTYYMDEESSPTLSTQRGTPYISNPPYQNNYCGGTYPCDIVSPMFPVLYSRNYKWKVTACNGAGSCTDSDIMHFTVRDAPGWWQTVGGGDVYGVDVQSEIGEKASPALIILN